MAALSSQQTSARALISMCKIPSLKKCTGLFFSSACWLVLLMPRKMRSKRVPFPGIAHAPAATAALCVAGRVARAAALVAALMAAVRACSPRPG